MKKHFALPGFWENRQILIPLLSLYKQNPFFFYDDIIIEAVFGNFTHVIWDGGRPFNRTQFFSNLEDIEIIQNIYNNILNISIRFVCSNLFIQQQDCYDKFGNLILSLCENNKNNIIVGSSYLENYIRNKYPKYQFISSTTKCLNSEEEIINELKKDYILVCLPYNKNFDFEFLQKIPNNLKSKIELLINEKCYINCPIRQKHYIEISKTNYLYNYEYINQFKCFNNNLKTWSQTAIIPYEQLNKYTDLNIKYYKLEGRIETNFLIVLQDIITYLIKPEWQLRIFQIISQWANNFDLNNYNIEKYNIK